MCAYGEKGNQHFFLMQGEQCSWSLATFTCISAALKTAGGAGRIGDLNCINAMGCCRGVEECSDPKVEGG